LSADPSRSNYSILACSLCSPPPSSVYKNSVYMVSIGLPKTLSSMRATGAGCINWCDDGHLLKVHVEVKKRNYSTAASGSFPQADDCSLARQPRIRPKLTTTAVLIKPWRCSGFLSVPSRSHSCSQLQPANLTPPVSGPPPHVNRKRSQQIDSRRQDSL
jgi:hypothetical protein